MAKARKPPASTKTSLSITMVPISDLRPAEYNPRTHDDGQKAQLLQSIREFEMVEPIIANTAPGRENVIIGGHFRWECCKELGFTEVPVIYLRIPDLEREKELCIRLNKNTGEFDLEKLKAFDIDFLLGIGFGDEDLGKIWDDMLETEDDGFDLEKAAADIQESKAKTGDLYEVAGHRIICGDSTDPDVIKRLVGDTRIDMLYSDPPYNISLNYSSGISGKMQYGGKTQDNKSDEEYEKFLETTLRNGLAVCRPDCHAFTYCDQKYIGLLQAIYPKVGIDFKRVALYIKNNFNLTPQTAFNKCYEPCIYGTRGSPYLSPRAQNFTEILNKEISNGNRAMEDILDGLDIWLCKRLPSSEYEHPTAKNPLLHERPLRRCSKVGDSVLDLFGGSGSTLIAAHQLKRKAFLVEWEPLFVDVILRRFEKAFGIAPTLLNP